MPTHLSKLILSNFRCFSSKRFEFSPGYNPIYAPNGAGKTSTLEAIYYTCYAASFRGGVRGDLIKHGAPQTLIKAKIEGGADPEKTIFLGFDQDRKVLRINDKNIKSQKEVLAALRPVILHHKDIEIVSGYPEAGRAFIQQLSNLSENSNTDNHYRLKAILKNRKALLESGNPDPSLLKIWTNKLVDVSEKIRAANTKIAENLEQEINTLNDKFKIGIKYHSAEISMTPEMQAKELLCQRNLFGPQHDQLDLTLDGQSAKRFASRGQQKIITLLLKAASTQLLSKLPNPGAVILLIDDFFSELDQTNQAWGEELIKSLPCQKIVVCPKENS